MKIVAIGGGDMGLGETFEIDREIVRLTGKPKPKAVFLPTASFDSLDYWDRFQAIYRGRLGCEVEVLFLWEGYRPAEIEETIQATKWNATPHRWEFRGDPDVVEKAVSEADLVYVGGGNTRRLLELWRSIGLDQWLNEAAERGAVLSGLSAGCICWGRYGNSDAALTEDLGKPTMSLDCLDYLPIALCPHMSREGFRFEEFRAMMQETPGVGIGLDDGAALQYEDGNYRVLSCIEGAVAHRFTATSHRIVEPSDDYESFDSLLAG